jgi:hypothetical protein
MTHTQCVVFNHYRCTAGGQTPRKHVAYIVQIEAQPCIILYYIYIYAGFIQWILTLNTVLHLYYWLIQCRLHTISALYVIDLYSTDCTLYLHYMSLTYTVQTAHYICIICHWLIQCRLHTISALYATGLIQYTYNADIACGLHCT